jgi:hypothetical protein
MPIWMLGCLFYVDERSRVKAYSELYKFGEGGSAYAVQYWNE